MQKQHIIFSILILLSLGVSMYSLFTQSIRLDEAQSIWQANRTIPAIMDIISADVHVPLYHTLLHFWMQIFGTDIAVVRMLSFIFFILTLPILYILAEEMSNNRVAWLTVLLFSLSPFVIWYTTEARMYTLFTFATTLSHLFFLRFIRSQGKTNKLNYFLTLLLGFYSHYFFFFVVATQGFFLLLRYIQTTYANNQEEANKYKALFFSFLGMSLSAFLFLVPWLFFVFKNGGASHTKPLIAAPSTYNILETFVSFLFGFQSQTLDAVLVSLWPIAVALLFLIFTRQKKTDLQYIDYFALMTFLPILLVFLISYIRPIFLSRYLILVTPSLFFMIASILMEHSKVTARYVSTALITVMVLLLFYQTTSAQTPVKEDYKGAAMYLQQHISTQDIIVVSSPFTIYPLEYSYSGSAAIDTIPQWDNYSAGAIPPFSEKNMQQQINKYKTQYQNMYIVLSYDQGYEKKVRNYLDTHFQLLDHKTFSPGLQIRVYKLRYP